MLVHLNNICSSGVEALNDDGSEDAPAGARAFGFVHTFQGLETTARVDRYFRQRVSQL